MIDIRRSTSIQRRRNGTTAVEMACILPVFLTMVFGLVQICHGQMIEYVLKSACRNAARTASAGTMTTAQAKDVLKDIASCAVPSSKITVMVKNGSAFDTAGNVPDSTSDFQDLADIELSTATPRQLYLVQASVNYNDVAIVSLPFLKNMTISAHALMRHE